MSVSSTIRHSFVGRCARQAIHIAYRLKHPAGAVAEYSLPGGVRLQLHPEGEVAEFLEFGGLFERTEVALVSAFLKPGMTVLDVGANVGLYSILAQSRVGAAGKVWAFEPSPESYARLLKNLSLNQCQSVTPVQLALSDRPKTVLMLRTAKGFGDAYRYLADGPSNGSVSTEEPVPVTTLDQWSADQGLGSVDFLKVDIEGGEFRMLTGARRFLNANPNIVIFFENESDWCSRAGHTQEDALQLLEQLNFGVYAWDGARRSWTGDRQKLLKNSMLWACRNPAVLPIL